MHVTLLSGDFLDTNNARSLSFAFALHDLVPFPELETPSSGEVAGGAGGAVAPPAGLKKGAPK